MNVLIDSIDKRMTVPLIDQLSKAGHRVFGMGFSGGQVLNEKALEKTYELDKDKLEDALLDVFKDFNSEDVLLIGNPKIIQVVNRIKPDMKYILPSDQMVDAANNKEGLEEIASSLAIKYPKKQEEPVVGTIVKLKCSENTTLKPAQRYRIVESEKDLQEATSFMDSNDGNFLVQEYVSGPGYGVSMLLDENSNLIDYICHKRLLEYPISGGPSALCESVYNEKRVNDALKLLQAIKWQGFAMVEFKGEHLIEINPRFWGSMPLIFRANSSFFTNYIKVVQGQASPLKPSQVPYRVGVKMGYFPQGLVAVISHLKSGNTKKGIKGLGQMMTSKEGIFSWSNPRPFAKYIKGLFGR